LLRAIFWAFPYGSGYPLQCFFAAGATQKTISAAIPNAQAAFFKDLRQTIHEKNT
jgi:hypothetical protein